LSALNQNVASRIEKGVTKTTDVIYNQHIVIDAKDVKAEDLEQNKLILRIFSNLTLISEFSIDLLSI